MVKYTRLLIKRIKVLKLKAIAATALLLMLMAIFMMKPGVAFPTKVYVNPPAIVDPTMVPGTTFSIAVTVDLVEELWGYQIEMVFDPEVLHGVDYADGPFLGSAGGNVIFVPGMGFDNEIGKLYLFSAALFPKVDFPTGGGPLAFFTFEVVGTGTSPLQFGYDSGLLNKTGGFDLGPDWEPIHKVENPDVFIDGYFDNRLAVAVDPPEVSGTWVGESFTVNITAPNIEDVYAWSFYLNWNATMLNATNVVEGDLLKGQPDGTDFYESISNDDGYLYANATTIGSYPGVSGGGTMATVTFEVEDVGNTTLHLYDVLMWNSTLNIIDVITADGWFTNLVRVLNLDTGIYYATIQSAIDAAETLDGHTILVTAGNYFENVILSKSLTLVGEDPYSTIIDAGGNAVAVDVWADDTTIDGFTIRNAAEDGILVYDYHNSTIIGNFIMDCTWDGISLMYSNNNTIENNVFIEHAEWGGLYLQYSDGNTIENNVFIENGDYGLYIESSNNNLIYGNTISLTLGISLELWDTQGNMIVGNTISNSGSVAVELDVSNDTVFHNNFLDNAEQVWDWGTDTTWDNGSEGNYWSDYGGEDTDGDGIGDTLIPHQDVDNFPLMTPWPMGWDIVFEDETYSVSTVSNSTVTFMKFSQLDKQITFNVTRPDSTTGFCNITIPKALLNAPIDQWIVLVNGTQVDPNPIVTKNCTHTFIYFTYSHSTQLVQVMGTNPADSTPPVADAGPDQTVDEDTIVTFDGSGSTDNIGIIGYTWTFVDVTPQTLTGVSPNYNFANPGIYTVTLNVTDARCNWDTDDVVITVLDVTSPVADAGPDQTVDEDTLVTFDGSGSADNAGVVSYVWTFMDESVLQTLSGVSPTYTFSTPDVYTVTLNVSDAAGNWDTDIIVITVLDVTPPVTDAGPDQTVDEDTLVTFDGSGSTDIVGIASYTWTFVDVTPQTLTGVNPTYTFQTPGIYTVTLNVTDTAGNWATDTVIITVVDVTSPVADAGSDQTVDEDTEVAFDGSGSTDNVDIISYVWNFGDGTTGTGVTTTHTYTEPGTYTVTLNVTDARGNWDTDDVVITVLDVTSPVADAGPDQTVDEDTLVTLEGWRSTDNVGVASWTWTFTDVTPQTLTGENVTYTFAAPGTYTVTLNVSDATGNWDTDTVVITVVDVTSPVANAGPDQTVDEDTLVTFDGSGSTDNVAVVSWTWTFTDETLQTLTGVNPTYTFATPGTYTVTLTVSDAAGNSETDEVVIIVLDVTSPVAEPGSDKTAMVETSVSFDASDSTDNVGIVDYEWDFGDGTTGTSITTTHTYTSAGDYTVTLTVRDAAGNSDTESITVTITAPSEGVPLWMIVIAAIILILLALGGIILFMRKKP